MSPMGRNVGENGRCSLSFRILARSSLPCHSSEWTSLSKVACTTSPAHRLQTYRPMLTYKKNSNKGDRLKYHFPVFCDSECHITLSHRLEQFAMVLPMVGQEVMTVLQFNAVMTFMAVKMLRHVNLNMPSHSTCFFMDYLEERFV